MRTTIFVALLLTACGSAEPPPDPGPPAAGPIEASWVTTRVAESRARLDENEAGQLLWRSIEAHGGLATWLAHGTVEFEFDYQPLGNPARRMHTRSTVDLWRARAHQRELADEGVADEGVAELGWNGETAWITPDPDAFPSTARFWSTTPYYFVGIPHVLADPGATYERLDDQPLDGERLPAIRVSYEAGTGDSPDDYYVILFDRETHRVRAIRYIVAFPGFFEAGAHSPEKLMRYEDLREVQGLLVPHRLNTFRWDAETGEVGEMVTEIEAGGYRFGQTVPASRFAAPEGASTSQDIPAPSR